MGGTRAEEDDDEGFGDFTVAPFPNQGIRSNQINGRKSTADEDDEWGDFVESPLRSGVSSGFSNGQSLSNLSGSSKPFDPFGFFSDHSTTPVQSAASPTESFSSPTHAESEKTQWAKPKGALPLSLFGDVEQPDQRSGAVNPPVGDDNDSVGDKHAGNVRNGSNMVIGLALNDIIANLYTQNQQIKTEDGLNSNSNGSNLNGNSNLIAISSNSRGLNLHSDSFAGNNNSQSSQIKAVAGLSMNLDFFAGNHDTQVQQINIVNGLNSYSIEGNIDKDLNFRNNDFGALTNVVSQSQQNKAENSNGLNPNVNVSTSNTTGTHSYFDGLISNLDPPGQTEEFDSDDDGWEFMDAYSEPKVGDEKDKVVKDLGNSEVTGFSSGLGNGPHDGPIDLFSASNGFSGKPREVDISFDLKPMMVAQNGFISDSLVETEQKSIENGLKSDLPGQNEEFEVDGDSWEFKDAYSELKVEGGKNKDDGKAQGNSDAAGFASEFGDGSHGSIDLFSASNGFSGKPRDMGINFDLNPSTAVRNGFSSQSFFQSEKNGHVSNSEPAVETEDFDDSFGDFEVAFSGPGLKQEGNETLFENHKGALPLSIFGDEEVENESLEVQDAFTYKPSVQPRNGISGQGSNIPIHDLLSNLYSQAEQQAHSTGNTEKNTGNGLNSDKVTDCRLVNPEDDFDDGSWEFRDAFSQTRADSQISLHSPGDAALNVSTRLRLKNYLDFYCSLKDELSFVCRFHLDNLKKTRNTAALSGEDAKVAAIEKQIQEACKELHEANLQEYSEDQLPRDICLSDFIEVLLEEKFQVLESEYNLSRRLQLAEKDLSSAIELMKHTTTVLTVLIVGSMEDQDIYVSTWFKMISLCTQELRHGSWIWKQLADTKSSLLSKSRGKQYIIALGEIYRVVVILGASIKLYKPWMLSSSLNSSSIYALVEECNTLWSSSGIEEALQGISDPIDFEYHSTVKALLESIKYILDLDGLPLSKHVSNQQVSSCRLSLLTSEAVPGMKMVFWNGEYYFLTLANLWANLISCDPPVLPHFRFSSCEES